MRKRNSLSGSSQMSLRWFAMMIPEAPLRGRHFGFIMYNSLRAVPESLDSR